MRLCFLAPQRPSLRHQRVDGATVTAVVYAAVTLLIAPKRGTKAATVCQERSPTKRGSSPGATAWCLMFLRPS